MFFLRHSVVSPAVVVYIFHVSVTVSWMEISCILWVNVNVMQEKCSWYSDCLISRGYLWNKKFCNNFGLILHTDLYKVPDAIPPIHAVSSHVATDKGPSKFRLFLATIYNQSQLTERKHVARYWSISAVSVSAHPSSLVITTKLVAAILVVAVVPRRGAASPVLPLWFYMWPCLKQKWKSFTTLVKLFLHHGYT